MKVIRLEELKKLQQANLILQRDNRLLNRHVVELEKEIRRLKLKAANRSNQED
jgi:hypothetical protein